MNKDIIEVSVKGLNLSLFLSRVMSLDVTISSLYRKSDKEIRFKICFQDFKKIKKAKFARFYTIKVVNKLGLKNIIFNAFKYCGLVLGIGLGFLCFWYSSIFISSVNILSDNTPHVCENNENCIFNSNNLDNIKTYLESLGVKKGEKISTIHAMDIERKLVSKFDAISACSINSIGTKLEITLHEAKLDSMHSNNILDIIAPENLKVQSVTTSRGLPQVKAGDIVKKGQVLVKSINNEPAIASINATLFYKTGLVYSEHQVSLESTGNYITKSYIECLGLEIFKEKDINIPYIYYEVSTQSKVINSNLFLPIKIVTIKIKELQETQSVIPIEEKRNELEAELNNNFIKDMNGELPSSYKSRYVLTKITDGVFLLDCYVEYDTIISNKIHV